MGRLLKTAALLLSLALAAGAASASAAPRKGASKKGSAKSSGAAASKGADKSLDPLGEIGSGGSRTVPASASASSSSGGGGTPPQRGPSRIDFDDRLIQGQTNKSGAVYLYDRKELQVKSMVKRRESFRQEILSTVYDTQN